MGFGGKMWDFCIVLERIIYDLERTHKKRDTFVFPSLLYLSILLLLLLLVLFADYYLAHYLEESSTTFYHPFDSLFF